MRTDGVAQGWLTDRTLNFDGTSSPLKVLLFLLICFSWILAGLTGHTPWKYDEAVSQGIIHGMIRGGSWLAPTLAGEPYLSHPPIYYWVGASLIRASADTIPHHDAARLASGLFMAATFWALALTARHLYGQHASRLAVLVLIGCVGLVIRAHEMSSSLVWMTGMTWLLAALPVGRTLSGRGGWLGGTGLGIVFLAQGTLAFPLLLPLLLLTPALIPEFRPPHPTRFVVAFLLGALPSVAIWPTLMIFREPAAWALWKPLLLTPLLHPQLWIAPDRHPWFPWTTIIWFAWPATPLVLGAFWHDGNSLWKRPQTRFLVLVFLYWALILGFCTPAREDNLLPLLLPLALLVSGTLDLLRRGATSALDWFGMLTFGLLTLLLWLGWIAQMTGWPTSIVHYLNAQLPDFHPHFQGWPFTFSLFLTLVWAFTIFHSHPSARRAMMNWSVGMTVSWMLTMSLWLPYVEASRSYEGVMISLHQALPHTHGCVMSSGLGEPQRGLLYYDLDLITERQELGSHPHCALWLVQSNGQTPFLIPLGWHLRWSGTRPGDRNERLLLLARTGR